MARAMVTQYGMSEKLGPISYDSSDHSIFIGRDFGQTKSYSEETAALIDAEVKRIFDEAESVCEKLLLEHKDTLIAVAEYLLQNETMDGEEFNYFCDHGELPPPKPAPRLHDDTIEPPARKISMFIDDDPAAPPTPEQSGEARGDAVQAFRELLDAADATEPDDASRTETAADENSDNKE